MGTRSLLLFALACAGAVMMLRLERTVTKRVAQASHRAGAFVTKAEGASGASVVDDATSVPVPRARLALHHHYGAEPFALRSVCLDFESGDIVLPAPGSVEIDADGTVELLWPSGAVVDDVRRIADVAPGRYVARATRGGTTVEKEVLVVAGETAKVTFRGD